MKKFNIYFIVIALLTLLSSCDNKASMLTVINKDGSFCRKLTFVSDSAAMHGNIDTNLLWYNVLASNKWTTANIINDAIDILVDNYETLFNGILSLNVDYKLSMPSARIIDCGNGVIKDGYISYSLSDTRFLSPDYTITATFRSTNYWAYIVSGLILILALVSWFILRKK